MTKENQQPAKRFKKIPIHVVEEHNDALQYIYSAIGGKKLPLEDNTLLHLDAHPDMLIDRKLLGVQARSGRKLLPLLQIENWIVPAAAAGYIGRVIWLRPPWAKQFRDGTRRIAVGDHPDSGFLRVNCKEPYYMSDALYTPELLHKKEFTLTVSELGLPLNNEENNSLRINNLLNDIKIDSPYILDIDLDFFSTGNPFLSLHENINLYDRLEPIFGFELPEDDDDESVEKIAQTREQQLQELEDLFGHLEENNSLDDYCGEKSDRYKMVLELVKDLHAESEKLGKPIDWWAVYAGGCTRDQGGLPYHISSEIEIRSMVDMSLKPMLEGLPPPVLITISRSADDGYCPLDQVDKIQSLVLETLKTVYDTNEPALHYLCVNTL